MNYLDRNKFCSKFKRGETSSIELFFRGQAEVLRQIAAKKLGKILTP
jgi:hypothetical protein